MRLARLACELSFAVDADDGARGPGECAGAAGVSRRSGSSPSSSGSSLRTAARGPGADGLASARPRWCCRSWRALRGRRAEPLPPSRRLRPHAGGARRGDRARARSGARRSASSRGASRELLAEPLANELTRGQALRFGALLHDIAKPQTRAVTDEGRVTFMGHDARRRGAGLARSSGGCGRQRAAVRARRRADPAPPPARVPRPRDAAVPARALPLPAQLRAGRGRRHAAERRRPARHPRRHAERAIASHLELARQMLGEALAWEAAPPRAAGPRRRAGPRAGDRAGPASSGGCSRARARRVRRRGRTRRAGDRARARAARAAE